MTERTQQKNPVSPSHGLFTVAGIMRRVRVAASLRKEQRDLAGLASYTNDPFSVPVWNSAESNMATRPQYELPELLRASDADFVMNAYQAILRRPADPTGRDAFLRQLRNGSMDKVDVLAELRWSEEGVQRGVHVNGLLLPHLVRKWGRKRFIGPCLRWVHAVLTVHRAQHQAQLAENILARDVQDLGRHMGSFADKFGEGLQRHEDTLDILHEQLQQLRMELRKQASNRKRIGHLESHYSQLQRELDESAKSQSDLNRTQDMRLDAHERSLGAQDQRLDVQDRNLQEHAAKLSALDARQAEVDANEARARQRTTRLDSVYSEFEDEFRGPRELIRARLQPYVGLLRDSGQVNDEHPVLDLGAGRGEWVQMLGEAGLAARGVDTNSEFVMACKQLGLDVQETDALKVLDEQPPGTLGAITTMHLVEHLPFEDVVSLIEGSLRALVPGGVLIIETPNPENLRVASHNFYLDPTHRNPLPPIMMRWLVENRGFQDVEILRLTEHRPWPTLPRLPESSEMAASLNPLLEWTETAPDYAIVARKPRE